MVRQCDKCGREFPARLINPLETGTIAPDGSTSGVQVVRVCPLCALELVRATTGNPDYMFSGPGALAAYQEAQAYVKGH
jgi:hypothetical protein